MEEQPSFLRQLPPEEKSAWRISKDGTTYSPTKVFEIQSGVAPERETGEKKNVVIITRDRGARERALAGDGAVAAGRFN